VITGGAGDIGSHAARALRRSGYEVVLYDSLSTGFERLAQGLKLVKGDIADEGKFRPVLARVDAVMNFAAHAYVGESVENPRKHFRDNAVAALSLLNSALDAGIRRLVKFRLTREDSARAGQSLWRVESFSRLAGHQSGDRPGTFRSRSHPSSGKRYWTPGSAKDGTAAAGRSSDPGGRSGAGKSGLGWTAKRNLADIVSSAWIWMQQNSSGS
jgi:UDP-glucose 4-epimerase